MVWAITVGVPLITPLEGFKLSPGGKVPPLIIQVKGFVPPVAVRVVEYELLTVAEGRDCVVIVKGCACALVAAASSRMTARTKRVASFVTVTSDLELRKTLEN